MPTCSKCHAVHEGTGTDHLRSVHLARQSVSKVIFLCPECPFRSFGMNERDRHVREQHPAVDLTLPLALWLEPDLQFHCSKCTTSFDHRRQLKEHFDRAHASEIPESGEDVQQSTEESSEDNEEEEENEAPLETPPEAPPANSAVHPPPDRVVQPRREPPEDSAGPSVPPKRPRNEADRPATGEAGSSSNDRPLPTPLPNGRQSGADSGSLSFLMNTLLAQPPVVYYDYKKLRDKFGPFPITAWLSFPNCKVLFIRHNTDEFPNEPLFEQPPLDAPIISSLMARFDAPPNADRTAYLLGFAKADAGEAAARLLPQTNNFTIFSELLSDLVPSLGVDSALLITSDADRRTVLAFDQTTSNVRYHVV